ncbi:hypothetical protein ACFSTC_34010 [Nonomuraea ferruginea]
MSIEAIDVARTDGGPPVGRGRRHARGRGGVVGRAAPARGRQAVRGARAARRRARGRAARRLERAQPAGRVRGAARGGRCPAAAWCSRTGPTSGSTASTAATRCR